MKNKVIHYCWFGHNSKPALIQKCIKSWKKYCPEYEIKEWNESNFDVNCCDYVKEAYKAKKWAFVSDYCRFYILYKYGGVYLDTDVQLIKSIDDLGDTFVGFEVESHVASGLIRAAKKGDAICKEMLDSYAKSHFQNKEGNLNLLTVCDRETQILVKHGLLLNNKYQEICDTKIYPSEYFQPTDMATGKIHLTPNTIAIHHYAASWESKSSVFRGKVYRLLNRCFGKNAADRLRSMLKN